MQTFMDSRQLAIEKQMGQSVKTAPVETGITLVQPPAASLEMTDGLKDQERHRFATLTPTPLTFQAGVYAEVQGERNGRVDDRVRLSDIIFWSDRVIVSRD